MSSARVPLLALATLGAVHVAIAVHASIRRSERETIEPAVLAIAALLPGADLSLAGGARHLRFASLEEPGAAFADGPGSPDLDPAGGAIAPPTEVYQEIDRQNHPVAFRHEHPPSGRSPVVRPVAE